MRTTSHRALTASTMLGLVACTDVHCLDNERQVGAVCYPVRTAEKVDAAATAAATEDAGRTDSGSARSTLDGATVIDGATARGDAKAAPTTHAPIGEDSATVPQEDAAATTFPGRDAAAPPATATATDASAAGATDAAAAGATDAATDVPDAAPPRCGGHPEVCDGVDNDCDGTTDEDAMDARSWYEDCDGDGFGKLENSVKGCSAPTRPAACKAYVTTLPSFPVTLDCHDDAVAFHPGREYGGAVLDDGTPVTGPLLWDADCNGKVELSPMVSDPGPLPMYNPYCPAAGDPCTTPDAVPCARLDLPSLASVDACTRGPSVGATVYELIDRQCVATKRLVSVLCR